MKRNIIILMAILLCLSTIIVAIKFNDIEKHLYARYHNIIVRDLQNYNCNNKIDVYDLDQRGQYKVCIPSDSNYTSLKVEIIDLPKNKVVFSEVISNDYIFTVSYGSQNNSFLGKILIYDENGNVLFQDYYWLFGWER